MKRRKNVTIWNPMTKLNRSGICQNIFNVFVQNKELKTVYRTTLTQCALWKNSINIISKQVQKNQILFVKKLH